MEDHYWIRQRRRSDLLLPQSTPCLCPPSPLPFLPQLPPLPLHPFLLLPRAPTALQLSSPPYNLPKAVRHLIVLMLVAPSPPLPLNAEDSSPLLPLHFLLLLLPLLYLIARRDIQRASVRALWRLVLLLLPPLHLFLL